MLDMIFVAVIAGVPILSLTIELLGDRNISERHHSHHDTYLMPRSISSAFMLMMVFVGMLGLVVGWLCSIDIFMSDPQVLHSFFASFLSVTFLMWLGVRRYRVMTFDDRLQVRPALGFTRTVRYDEIRSIRWYRRTPGTGLRSVRIFSTYGSVLIWGALDIEQILARINRFDVLEGTDVR